MTDAKPTTSTSKLDESKVAYQLPQPAGMVPEIFVPAVLDLDGGDPRDWVPQSAHVSFKPLILNVSQGYYVNILRVRQSGVLSRHRHSGPVHALTLRGTWRYLEHDWVASAGDYAFEPAGETHTLVVPDDAAGMTRCSTSPAATPTSILTGSRWATRTCSPNLRRRADITSR